MRRGHRLLLLSTCVLRSAVATAALRDLEYSSSASSSDDEDGKGIDGGWSRHGTDDDCADWLAPGSTGLAARRRTGGHKSRRRLPLFFEKSNPMIFKGFLVFSTFWF